MRVSIRRRRHGEWERSESPASPEASSGDRLHSSCWAPFASLYLDPKGDVQACCMNRWQRLGNVGDSGLRALWDGPEMERLRSALAADDFSLGCELCARRTVDEPQTSYSHVYDDLAVSDPSPRWPQSLELALSNACNLQCVMCNGELSSAIRTHRERRAPLPRIYDERFFRELDEFLPHLKRVTFLGGEPFLAREALRVMERIVELGLSPACHVTTNGTQWNRRVRELVEALPMHVAVSVDGADAATVERIRVGVDHRRLRSNIGDMREALRRSGGSMSLSFSLMTLNWHEFRQVLRWSDGMDMDVFVNAVDFPSRFALRHLSATSLDHVVEELREQEATSEPLERNAAVWRRELDALESIRNQRRAAPSPVDLGPQTHVADIEVDGNQIISWVDVSGADLGVDLHAMAGRPLADLQNELIKILGPATRSDLLPSGSGEERRVVAFGTAPDGIELVLEATVRERGERWSVSVRGQSTDAVAPSSLEADDDGPASSPAG